MRSEAEVLDCFTVALWSAEEDDIGTGWRAHGKLVEGDALTTRLLNASTSSCGEAQSTDGHLWNFIDAVVVGNSAYDRARLAFECLCGVRICGHSNDL